MANVTLRMWHGGKFKKFPKDPKLQYMGGQCKVYDRIDPDLLCFWWLKELALECATYKRIDELYYVIPGSDLDTGLMRVYHDQEVVEMTAHVLRNGTIDVYVVHGADEPIGIEIDSEVVMGASGLTVGCDPHSIDDPPLNADGKIHRKKMSLKGAFKSTSVGLTTDDTGPTYDNTPLKDHQDLKQNPNYEYSSSLSDSDDPNYEPECEDTDGEDVQFEYEDENMQHDKHGGKKHVGVDDEVETTFQENILGSDIGTSDEEFQDARASLNKWNEQVESVGVQPGARQQDTNEQMEGDGEFVSEYEDSEDEVHTQWESEEDDIGGRKKRSKIPYVNELTDFSKLQWQVGMRFDNREKFRQAVAKYAVAQGRDLRFEISDMKRGQRLGAKCVIGCPFKLYGSWNSNKKSFVVTAVNDKHECSRSMDANTQMKSSWLADQFLEIFKSRPHWPAQEIIDTVRRVYRVIIHKGFAYKVKYHAHQKLHGSMTEHYNKIGRYLKALTDENPDSYFKLETVPSKGEGPPIFQRFFVCFEGLKNGWLLGCMKVLCIDACFLKIFLGGVLLAAIGGDANDQMYPVAWAVAEGENNESWSWFLEQFRQCIGETNEGHGWTIISDQHLAILNGVAAILPKAEHRHCARHVFF